MKETQDQKAAREYAEKACPMDPCGVKKHSKTFTGGIAYGRLSALNEVKRIKELHEDYTQVMAGEFKRLAIKSIRERYKK